MPNIFLFNHNLETMHHIVFLFKGGVISENKQVKTYIHIQGQTKKAFLNN